MGVEKEKIKTALKSKTLFYVLLPVTLGFILDLLVRDILPENIYTFVCIIVAGVFVVSFLETFIKER